MLGRLPSSDEPCWLVAGDEVEEPIGASQRLPTTAVRPRAQGWKASFLAFLASVQTSQSIRQARSDPNFCSPHGRASRRSVVMVGVGARRPTRRRWASCGGRGTSIVRISAVFRYHQVSVGVCDTVCMGRIRRRFDLADSDVVTYRCGRSAAASTIGIDYDQIHHSLAGVELFSTISRVQRA